MMSLKKDNQKIIEIQENIKSIDKVKLIENLEIKPIIVIIIITIEIQIPIQLLAEIDLFHVQDPLYVI